MKPIQALNSTRKTDLWVDNEYAIQKAYEQMKHVYQSLNDFNEQKNYIPEKSRSYTTQKKENVPMKKLNAKIAELEAQGLSKEQIQLQTQELFDQVINEPLDESAKYVVDLNVSVSIDTTLKLEVLRALLHDLEIKSMAIGLGNNKVDTGVLHAELEGIEEWDNL